MPLYMMHPGMVAMAGTNNGTGIPGGGGRDSKPKRVRNRAKAPAKGRGGGGAASRTARRKTTATRGASDKPSSVVLDHGAVLERLSAIQGAGQAFAYGAVGSVAMPSPTASTLPSSSQPSYASGVGGTSAFYTDVSGHNGGHADTNPAGSGTTTDPSSHTGVEAVHDGKGIKVTLLKPTKNCNELEAYKKLRSFNFVKGHTFTLGSTRASRSLPLGLTTLRKHSTSARMQYLDKARDLRLRRAIMTKSDMILGTKRRVVVKTGGGGDDAEDTPEDTPLGEAKHGGLAGTPPGVLVVYTRDQATTNWFGSAPPVDKSMGSMSASKKHTAAAAAAAVARGEHGDAAVGAASLLALFANSPTAPTPPGGNGSPSSSASATPRRRKVRGSDKRTHITLPMTRTYTITNGKATRPTPPSPLHQPKPPSSTSARQRRGSSGSAGGRGTGALPSSSDDDAVVSPRRRRPSMTTWQPSDDDVMSDIEALEEDGDGGSGRDTSDDEHPEASDSADDSDDHPAPPPSAFRNSFVLVDTADPSKTRCFATAATAVQYLRLPSKTTFYDARRNETAVRGWFVFDGTDYCRKTGKAITAQRIQKTDAVWRAEYAADVERHRNDDDRSAVGDKSNDGSGDEAGGWTVGNPDGPDHPSGATGPARAAVPTRSSARVKGARRNAAATGDAGGVQRSRRTTAGKRSQPIYAEEQAHEDDSEDGDAVDGSGVAPLEVCRVCRKGGTLLLCDGDGCGGAYHLNCVGVKRVPKGDWFCRDCVTGAKRRPTGGTGKSSQSSKQKRTADEEGEGASGGGKSAPPPRCDCGRYYSSLELVEACRRKCRGRTDGAGTDGKAALDKARRRRSGKRAAGARHEGTDSGGVSRWVGSAGDTPNAPYPGYGLKQPEVPSTFDFPGIVAQSLLIRTFRCVSRDESQQLALASPTSPRQRPTLQSLFVPPTPPACPEDVADMDAYPLLRIGDTFEIGFTLHVETEITSPHWRILDADKHAAFALCNGSTKVAFESYYYDFYTGIVCLRCQCPPEDCTCEFPNDLITMSTRIQTVISLDRQQDSSSHLKICCKIPRKRVRGRTNSWNSRLRTIHGKSPKVMLLRVVEYTLLPASEEWEPVAVQQGYCRLIAKNGGLGLAYGSVGAPKQRRGSVGSPMTPTDTTRRPFTFPSSADEALAAHGGNGSDVSQSPSPIWEEDEADDDVFDDTAANKRSAAGTPTAADNGHGTTHTDAAMATAAASSKRRRLSTSSMDSDMGRSGRSNLPSASIAVLKQWLSEHTDNPYPTEMQKKALAAQLGLSQTQISYWFINARRRLLSQMMLSTKGTPPGAANGDNGSNSD